ncbi:MAG: hypothetical protein HYT76_09205 [Deltaproteobacteria bacterium]|nr:hypothetical protein [Deltaproteobacteria bacterium]
MKHTRSSAVLVVGLTVLFSIVFSEIGAEQKKPNLPSSIVMAKGSITGQINGEDIEANVQTLCDLNTGELIATADFTKTPDDFDKRFLNTIILTGQPRCSKAVGEALNPFRDAKVIKFTRTVSFSSGEEFVGNVTYDVGSKGMITARYELKGETPKVALASVEPAVEVWTPTSSGTVNGFFRMCWKTESNARVCADAKSEYSQEGSSTMSSFVSPHHRYITIQSSVDGNRFEQEERITLFKEYPGHAIDLRNLKKFKGVISD